MTSTQKGGGWGGFEIFHVFADSTLFKKYIVGYKWGGQGEVGHLLVIFCGRHNWVTSKAIIKKSKCLESKRVRYSRNFNYKTYHNLITSPLIVITIATFSA